MWKEFEVQRFGIATARWKMLLPSVVVIIGLLAGGASQVLAFADNYVNSYNLSGYDPTYGPYTGGVYASNLVGSSPQILQGDQFNVSWTSIAASNVRSNWNQAGPVFHVFQYGPDNCALPFDYDGNWVSNQPNTSVYAKNATCGAGGQYGSYNNEARVFWPASQVVGGNYYYGGAEFRLDNGDLYSPARVKVANDIYFEGNLGSEKKDNTQVTWCPNNSGGTPQC
jgi:hypothetical protein